MSEDTALQIEILRGQLAETAAAQAAQLKEMTMAARDIACSVRAMALAQVVAAEVALDAAVNAADSVANYAQGAGLKQHFLTHGGMQLVNRHSDGLARARDALSGRR